MTGYALHPEAYNDIDEIRAWIARVVAAILRGRE
jgi:hypothetical protein